MSSPGACEYAQDAAGQGERNRFRHHLRHDMPTARAHGATDRHFFRARACSDQEEIHQVYGANEEEKKDAGLEEQKGRTNRANVLGMK